MELNNFLKMYLFINNIRYKIVSFISLWFISILGLVLLIFTNYKILGASAILFVATFIFINITIKRYLSIVHNLPRRINLEKVIRNINLSIFGHIKLDIYYKEIYKDLNYISRKVDVIKYKKKHPPWRCRYFMEKYKLSKNETFMLINWHNKKI